MCIKRRPPPKRHPDNLTQLWEALESTWAHIPVELVRHLVESIPQRIEAVLRAKEGVLLDIRKVFYMFCTLIVCHLADTFIQSSNCILFLIGCHGWNQTHDPVEKWVHVTHPTAAVVLTG